MSNWFRELGLFFLAVGGHAFTLLAGCAVTVVIGWFERHVLKKQMPLWADLLILWLFVFFACFQAWHDQYDRAEALAHPPAQPTQIFNIPPSPAPTLVFQPSSGKSQGADRGLEVPAIQRMTNAQLRSKVIEFTKNMNAFVSEYTKTTNERIQQVSNLMLIPPTLTGDAKEAAETRRKETISHQIQFAWSDFKLQFQAAYFAEATEYRDELLRRLGPKDPMTLQEQVSLIWGYEGMPEITTYTAANTGTYLEGLARKLPK